jgi:replicative DNA helicase
LGRIGASKIGSRKFCIEHWFSESAQRVHKPIADKIAADSERTFARVTLATVDYSPASSLPANLEAERSILGAILLDNHAYNEAAEQLHAEDFSLDAHRRIFARMQELMETARAVDLITLPEELSRRKELESIGGIPYLSGLLDGVPDRPSIEHYVKIVRDKAMLRGLIHTANAAVARASEQSDAADEILNDAEASILQLSERRIGRSFAGFHEIFKESYVTLDALLQRGQRITGLETHYEDLDNLTSGLQPSDLVIIAARPSMGKTALALNIAENCATHDNKTVGIFSLEMAREALLLRLLCSRARVDSHRMRTGFLPKDDFHKLFRAYEELSNAPIFIDDTPGISLSEMRAKAHRLKHKNKLDLIVVDYLQLMSGGGRRYENRTQEVSAISRGLKALAKELRVPVLALSQLSRAPESRGTKDNEPKLSDLRESGAIEQDADVVMFIYRPEIYDRDNPDLKDKAKLIIAKQRNGPTDTLQLAFIKASTRFETLDRPDWIV